MIVKMYETGQVDEGKLAFAVIAAKYEGQWIFVRNRMRTTWEIPGGHREAGETIEQAAGRELYEETGAVSFCLKPVCVYSVAGKSWVNETGEESFGMLFVAEVTQLGELPETEIAEIRLTDTIPEELTYPEIQPKLWEWVKSAFMAEILDR